MAKSRVDYNTLGPVPCEEDCVQINHDDFKRIAKIEMEAYINQLERIFPEAKEHDVQFSIKWFEHDFGQYGEVVAKYVDDNKSGYNYVFDVIDKNLPEHWDNEALEELQKAGVL